IIGSRRRVYASRHERENRWWAEGVSSSAKGELWTKEDKLSGVQVRVIRNIMGLARKGGKRGLYPAAYVDIPIKICVYRTARDIPMCVPRVIEFNGAEDSDDRG
ncbi:hypothetical protein FRC12_022050, partial [Ceratobasidium sp. 428]